MAVEGAKSTCRRCFSTDEMLRLTAVDELNLFGPEWTGSLESWMLLDHMDLGARPADWQRAF